MARSNQKSVTRLQKLFSSLFGDTGNDATAFQQNLTKAVHSVNNDIYFISLTPHMNNCHNVYMMYKNAQKVIPVDLHCVHADVEAWISDIKLSAKGFVDRVNEVTTQSLSTKSPIDEFAEADLGSAIRKMKRMRGNDKTHPSDLISQERLVRSLRRDIWDFEDELKIHFGKESLKSALEPFQAYFPIGCRSALEYKQAS